MAKIFLIGPMGSGKSTVGKALARRIKHPFYDADHEIENRCGVDIPTIFEFEGEAGFREREKRILSELTAMDPIVLATGGGAILKPANRKLLRDNGHVILLSVAIEEQLRRVSLNKNRPLLHGGDVENKLRKLMQERGALYEKTAHHIVHTDSSRMQTVVNSITTHLTDMGLIKPVAKRAGAGKAGSKQTARSRTRRRSDNKPSSTSTRAQKTTKKRTTQKRSAAVSERKPGPETKTDKSRTSNSNHQVKQKDNHTTTKTDGSSRKQRKKTDTRQQKKNT